jgi:hypothetical protein
MVRERVFHVLERERGGGMMRDAPARGWSHVTAGHSVIGVDSWPKARVSAVRDTVRSGSRAVKGLKRTRVRVSGLSKTTGTVLLGVMTTSLVLVSSAFALPSGRVYEMVSPGYKGGYGAH